MKTFLTVFIAILICYGGLLASCAEQPTAATTDIIMVQMKDDGGYTILLDGYGINWWSDSNIIVKIDTLVPENEPVADFLAWSNGKVNKYEPITMRFHNIDEARKALKSGTINIDGNNNVAVSQKNNNSGCFMSTF